MPEPKKPFIERRKGPDAVVKAVWWISAISWILIITALIFASRARPQIETFFDRFLKVPVRKHWNENLLQYVFFILLLNLIVCIVGFILNVLRQKRKTDRISKSIIILGSASLTGILWLLFRSLQ